MNFEEGAVLLINKPTQWTSFDVVNKIRYALQKKTKKKHKVGHAGTLDPLATGLLIVCTGKFTKQAELFQGLDKVYTGKFLLGKTTPSYDLETPFNSEKSIEGITKDKLMAAAQKIEAQTEQMPPIFSAIKKGGKTAYEEARLGNEIKLDTRKIQIYYFKIHAIDLPYISFEIKCSKGTYIRSVANDFGALLGCGACLAALCRTQVGNWQLKDAITINDAIEKIGNTPYIEPSTN